MGKVKDQEIRGNKNRGGSTAMTQSRSGSQGSTALDAAIAKLQAKGFDAAAETADRAEAPGNVVQDKELLCGVDMLVVNIRRKMSEEYGGMMSIVKSMLRTGEIVVITDGSTGVHKELQGFDPTPEKPLLIKGGLRKSTYPRKKRDEDGNVIYKTDSKGNAVIGSDGEPEPEYVLAPNGKPMMATTYHIAGTTDVSQIQGLNRNVNGTQGRQLRA